MKIIFKFIFI